jgi:hypothetical protein
MKPALPWFVACFFFLRFEGLAREDEFFRRFEQQLEAKPRFDLIHDDPSLVNANNTAPKLTRSKFGEIKIIPGIDLAGVRIGMKMEEVVTAWGKPKMISLDGWLCPLIATNHEAGPHFFYSDEAYVTAYVHFERASNSVMAITLTFPSFNGKPPSGPGAEECLRVLGEPTFRSISRDPLVPQSKRPERYRCRMIYDRPEASLALIFNGGVLTTIQANHYASSVDVRRSW